MSGDVQPRKRKDKKKRKDDGDGYSSNEDVTIHVHKDGGTGGNICAKIVFFFLFSALIVLIGLIIKENQGLNELESIEDESRFSQIFEGWIDKTPEEHDEEHSPELHDHDEEDDHEEEDEEHYKYEESDLEDDTEEDLSQEADEDTQEVEEDDSAPQSEEDEEEQDETIEDSEEAPQSEEDSAVEEDDEETNTEEDEVQSMEKNDDKNDSDEIEETAKNAQKDEESEEKIESKKDDGKKEDAGKATVEEKDKITKSTIKKIAEPEKTEVKEKPEESESPKEQEDIATDAGAKADVEPPKEGSGHVNVGEEPESDSDKDDYEHSNITNKDDYTIKEDIDAAQQQLNKNAAYANKMFEALLEKYPLSPRLLYGKAKALDILAETRQSNDLLKKALDYYVRTLNAPDVPDQLFVIAADRFIDRARFMGQYKKAIEAHWQLIERFPENSTYLNTLAVTYLTINLVEEARSTLKQVLSKWPEDGFALVHYGFILKTADNDLKDSVKYMTKGLKTKAPGVVDGRFYFHLGDALTRLGKNEEAMRLYEEGVKEKVFKSKYQRSLYNVDRLTAKPWWDPKDIPSYQNLFSALKENWSQIRQEGLSALNDQGYFQDEAENLKDTGTWKQLELFARGQKFSSNCAKSPVTCGIIQKFTDASGCRRGQSKFSVMHPGTHVWPHCGPTNCRLRIHLGLKVPPKTFIRVAEEIRSWKEGDIIIFDDSFEHEVWHNGSNFRLVLIVDVWHPNLTSTEKKSLSSI